MDSMSMNISPTPTSAMPMDSSMSSMDMDMSSMTMDMSQMRMIFFDASNTPLYSAAWTPTTVGQYAGTCIFLIVLSVIMRALLAYKTTFEANVRAKAMRRRYVVTVNPERPSVSSDEGESKTTATLTARGLTENVRVIEATRPTPGGSPSQPWRFSTDLPRALLVTAIVGVAYLLMLAVMTMNVGYFMSVLGGAFLGELFLGRFINAGHDEDHGH